MHYRVVVEDLRNRCALVPLPSSSSEVIEVETA